MSETIIGTIPDTWIDTTIGYLCDSYGGNVQTGPFGSQLHAEDYQEFGTPLVMPKNLGINKIDPEDIARISDEDVSRLSKHQLRVGDIIFPRRGDLSRYAHITVDYEGWLCGTGCLRIRINGNAIDTQFIAYYLAHANVQNWIHGNAVGTTMLNLNTKIMRALPVVIPPPETQRAIAHILGSLDDKIEANRRQNETLEATARAIFKSWFVDFDPVHAKANGEQADGMDVETAALFPDSFEDSELGMIPSGWGIKSLDAKVGGIANYQNGLALQKFPPENERDFLPVLKIRELRQGFADGKSNKASTSLKDECIVYDGDMIFSWSGSLLVDFWTGGIAALNQHLFKVTSTEYPKWFCYFWTKYHLSEFVRIAADKATTMGHIKRSHLKEAKAIIPSDTVLEIAHEIISPYIEKIVNLRLENRTLADLRDTLLPRLISGELKVGDIENV